MLADFKIVIDACVLANYGVCDLLLRLAESPRLFLPRWSSEILGEVNNVHLHKLKRPWPDELARSWQRAVHEAFPEALVDDYAHLIEHLDNDPKDRHVLATAIRSGASVIITFNLKDFRKEALEPWQIEACHPQDYLITLYSMAPQVVLHKLTQIAEKRNKELVELLLHLGKSLPNFVSHLIDDLDLDV